MAAVYSIVILAYHGITGVVTPPWTAPAGYVTILRDMDAFCSSDLGGVLQLYDEGARTFWSESVEPSPNGNWVQWNGRQVFEPGEEINVAGEVSGGTGHWDLRACGYQLLLP